MVENNSENKSQSSVNPGGARTYLSGLARAALGMAQKNEGSQTQPSLSRALWRPGSDSLRRFVSG